MNDILQHYVNLKRALAKPGEDNRKLVSLMPWLEVCGLNISVTHIAENDHEKLWYTVKAFKPVQGWLCHQSEVISITSGQLTEPDNDRGWILNGELANAEGKSLHIQQHPESGWLVTVLEETAGSDYLVQPFAFLSTDESLGKLCYRVYWEHDDNLGYQRRFSRFTGFASQGE